MEKPTDEEIEAAAKTHYESFINEGWEIVEPVLKQTYKERMRLAFAAAVEIREQRGDL